MTDAEIEQLQRERAEAINTAREWRRTWQIARGRALAHFSGIPEASHVLDYLSNELNALEHRTGNLPTAEVISRVMDGIKARSPGLEPSRR